MPCSCPAVDRRIQIIGSGVVLNEDVPNNTYVRVKQELERVPWGPEKYGW